MEAALPMNGARSDSIMSIHPNPYLDILGPQKKHFDVDYLVSK